MRRMREAGDTIVEVLVAVVVISVVIAGAYQATNSGLRIGQNAIERTQASQLLGAQAEAIRTLRDTSSTNPAWGNIVGQVTTIVPSQDVCANNNGTPTPGSEPFWLNLENDPLQLTEGTGTKDQFKYWVQAYKPTAATKYIDFYINGCWKALGESVPQNTSIVVRLVTE